jgi:hypothetical protein
VDGLISDRPFLHTIIILNAKLGLTVMINIWFDNLPFQIVSDNSAYVNSPNGGRFPHPNLKLYKKNLEDWFTLNRSDINKAREVINRKSILRLRIFLLVRSERIWTRDLNPKRFDAQNWIKGLIDGFTEMLGIDDCQYWQIEIEKVELDNLPWEQNDQVMINITDYTPRKLSDLKGGSL